MKDWTQEKRRKAKADHQYDYRNATIPGVANPRAYQPRAGGPPLLFATDIRMTILVTLALANGPLRQKSLWKHIGKKSKTALYPLVEHGLVAMWRLGRGRVFVALDPCHPAAIPLRAMLLKIAELFDGFVKPNFSVDDRDGGDAPTRPLRLRDVRYTFGDPNRTLSLLFVHLRGELVGIDIERIAPYVTGSTGRDILWMYRSFGLLTMQREIVHRRRGYAFKFNEANPLVPYIKGVLDELDRAMPQWRTRAERQRLEPLAKTVDKHRVRRKPNRWKW